MYKVLFTGGSGEDSYIEWEHLSFFIGKNCFLLILPFEF